MLFRRLFAAVLLSGASIPVLADNAGFQGIWEITRVSVAPWEDQTRPLVTDDAERYTGKVVTIGEDTIAGPDLLGCGKTELKIEALPYSGLFEGMLAADPKNPAGPNDEAKAAKLALDLGFKAEPVPSLFQGCSEIILHRRDDRTLLFGMNNRIFTLRKQ